MTNGDDDVHGGSSQPVALAETSHACSGLRFILDPPFSVLWQNPECITYLRAQANGCTNVILILLVTCSSPLPSLHHAPFLHRATPTKLRRAGRRTGLLWVDGWTDGWMNQVDNIILPCVLFSCLALREA